jgi:tetratricopeptide (TPR) repeat protein
MSRETVEADGPKVSEVLTQEILDELRQTARPHAFSSAARALADAVLALSEDDPEAAVAAGKEAKGSAPRSASVRELLGIALYQLGQYKAARTELAASLRISGQTDLTAMLADVERATGRPEQAIELFRTTDRTQMGADAAAELLLVAASAYGDMGQPAAGVALIRRHARWPAQLSDHHLRLAYAEGSLAEQAGDLDAAKAAFTRVTRIDPDFFDAAERLERLERRTAS